MKGFNVFKRRAAESLGASERTAERAIGRRGHELVRAFTGARREAAGLATEARHMLDRFERRRRWNRRRRKAILLGVWVGAAGLAAAAKTARKVA